MKMNLKNSKIMMAGTGVLGLLSLLLSSCLKDTSPNSTPPTALVTFYQASPDEPAMDLDFSTNKVNQSPLNYGDGIDYFSVFAGQRTVSFYNTGTLNTIKSITITVAPNNAYSLFLANIPVDPQVVLLTDTLNKPAAGKGSIRLVDLSPDAPSVDLAVQGGATLVTNRGFKGYSSFMPITGNTTYTFKILQAGTSTVLATLPNINIKSGFIYTILFDGLVTTANPADNLNATIITNAYFY